MLRSSRSLLQYPGFLSIPETARLPKIRGRLAGSERTFSRLRHPFHLQRLRSLSLSHVIDVKNQYPVHLKPAFWTELKMVRSLLLTCMNGGLQVGTRSAAILQEKQEQQFLHSCSNILICQLAAKTHSRFHESAFEGRKPMRSRVESRGARKGARQ